jgi:hypothetical protein
LRAAPGISGRRIAAAQRGRDSLASRHVSNQGDRLLDSNPDGGDVAITARMAGSYRAKNRPGWYGAMWFNQVARPAGLRVVHVHRPEPSPIR